MQGIDQSLSDMIKSDKKLGVNRRNNKKPGQQRQKQGPAKISKKIGSGIRKQKFEKSSAPAKRNQNQQGAKQNQQRSGNQSRFAGKIRVEERKQKLQQRRQRVGVVNKNKLLQRKPQQKNGKLFVQPKAQVQQVVNTITVVTGSLAQRKLKVRNIDANTVLNSDLQKLFSKCGPIVSARFDTNEFGQYLGSATVIYASSRDAFKAIRDYNGASLDNRVMKVEFCSAAPKVIPPTGGNGSKKQGLQIKPRQKNPAPRRQAPNAIRKNRGPQKAASGRPSARAGARSSTRPDRGGKTLGTRRTYRQKKNQ